MNARMPRFRRNRGPMIPEGTTHVLAHWPPFLLVPDMTGGQGSWDIQTLANHLAGTPADFPPNLDGAATVSETELAGFAERALGCPVTLTRFEISIENPGDGLWDYEDAYYVTPAG